MKDLATGKIYASKALKKSLGADFAKIGIDINKPFKPGELLITGLQILPDEFLDALAKHLGLLEEEKVPTAE